MKIWQTVEKLVQDRVACGALALNALLVGNAPGQQNLGALKIPPPTPLVATNPQSGNLAQGEQVTALQARAEAGNPRAQYELANYHRSISGNPDMRQARAWFEKSASQGYAPAQFELGKLLLQKSPAGADRNIAADLITAAAEQSHADAQVYLAQASVMGLHGFPASPQNAHKWARAAAEQGSVAAQFMMGSFCEAGWKHIPQDRAEAVRWFSKAAEQGDAQALFALGMTLQESEPERAAAAFKRAAGQGCSLSMVALGDLIAAESLPGVAKNECQSWFKKAADQGSPLGELFLGNALLNSGSAAEGLRHIQAAADKGLLSAYRLMYVHYLNDEPGRQANPSEAMAWLRKGAERGSAVCRFELGMCLYMGKNAARDVDEALGWFRKALDNSGNPHDLNAKFMIAQVEFEKRKSLSDESLKFLASAADGGMVSAQRLLGSHYLEQESPRRLENGAGIKYLKMAAEAGSANSALALGKLYADRERHKEAIPFLRMAAKAKHPHAYEPLGLALLESARRDDEGLSEALANFVEAAKLGYAESQFQAAKILRRGGDGVPKNGAQALSWATRSANQGNLKGARLLAEMYYTGGAGVPQDSVKSVWWHSVVAWGEDRGAPRVPDVEVNSETLLHRDFDPRTKVGMSSGARAKINRDARDNFKPKEERLPKAPVEELTLVDARNDILEEDVSVFRGKAIAGDPSAAAESLKRLAKISCPSTKFSAAMAFMDGLWVARDVAEGERLLKEAADAKQPQAQYYYAQLLADKTGGDAEAEVAWLEKAAANGVAHAQLALGRRLARSAQPAQGVRWLTEAAGDGNLDAKVELASLLQRLSVTGGMSEETKIEGLLREAAAKSHAGARFDLAQLLLKDPSRTERVQEGVVLLTKSAELGDATARALLGKIFLNGLNGIKADPQKAFSFFSQAAQVGSPEAHYYLGKILSDKDSALHNDAKAFKHFQSAAQSGIPEANHMVGAMLAEGRGAPQSPADAIGYLRKAAMQGFVESQIDLAEIYGGSLGKPFANQVNSYVWAQIAKTNGDKDADKIVMFLRSSLSESELVTAHDQIKKLWAEGKVRAPHLRDN